MASRGGARGGSTGSSDRRGKGDLDAGSPTGGPGSGRPKGSKPWTESRGGPSPTGSSVARTASEKSLGPDKAPEQPGYLLGMDPAQQDAHTRMLYVLMNAVGTRVNVSTKDGTVWEGILSHSGKTDGELGICLKMARRKDDGDSAKTYPELIIPPKELVSMTAAQLEFSSDRAVDAREMGFMTDTAISGYMETRERELIPWLPAEGDALESLGGIEHGGGGSRWDQFATNEKRFGVTTDYHEDIYTTKLDRSRPDFRAREKEAARLAAEIEKAPAAFAHVAEERGLEGDADDAGMDEEDKYSSVIRGPGKYVPPGARDSTPKVEVSATSPATEPTSETATPVSGSGQKAPDSVSSEPAPRKPTLPPQLQSVARVPGRPSKDTGASIVSDFREFSNKEKETLLNTRRDVQTRDRTNLLNDFKSFSANFQIKTPIPADLEPILHKTKAGKSPVTGTASISPVTGSASPTPSADSKTPPSETKEIGTTTDNAERASTPSDKGGKGKGFTFNVDAEEFSLNVEAAEFVPGGAPSGTRSPAFDKRPPNPARRTPSQSSWGQQSGPRPPMQRNVYPSGFEEMHPMMMPQYMPNMDPQMQGGFYPGQGPYMYPQVPPGAVMMPRPGFMPQGPPPMAMMPGGQPYMQYAPYGPGPGGPRPFPGQLVPMPLPPQQRFQGKGGPPMSPPQPGMYPRGPFPQQQMMVMGNNGAGMVYAGPPQQPSPPAEEGPNSG